MRHIFSSLRLGSNVKCVIGLNQVSVGKRAKSVSHDALAFNLTGSYNTVAGPHKSLTGSHILLCEPDSLLNKSSGLVYNSRALHCCYSNHFPKDQIKLGYVQSQSLCTGASDDGDFEEEYDDTVLDTEYNECVRYYCNIPHAGHRVFVIQPVVKSTAKKSVTTGSLMLEETCALVNTLPNWQIVGKIQLNVHGTGNKFVFGKGQLASLTQEIRRTPGVSAVFVSLNMLTQIQVNTLQNIWGLPVYDRYTIVLQIFKDHAKSQEAKLQIALAEIPFVRSRIEERHLDPRDRSGHSGGVHVPFHVADKIRYMIARTTLLQQKEKKLRAELSKLKIHRAVKRARRLKRKIPTVAVIGYTNSGKTTLIKALTGDEKMVPENRLFATLDVTAHAGYLPNNMMALFMDTVGFISNIPHSLYDAFEATLEDAILADLVVHVRDTSHPDTVAQKHNVLETVQSMLSETQLGTMIEVCNKMDKMPESLHKEEADCFYISSVTGEGLCELRKEIQSRLLSNMGYLVKKMRVPLNGPHLEWLQNEATVTATENDEDYESIILHVVISEEAYAKFMSRFGPKRSCLSR